MDAACLSLWYVATRVVPVPTHHCKCTQGLCCFCRPSTLHIQGAACIPSFSPHSPFVLPSYIPLLQTLHATPPLARGSVHFHCPHTFGPPCQGFSVPPFSIPLLFLLLWYRRCLEQSLNFGINWMWYSKVMLQTAKQKNAVRLAKVLVLIGQQNSL